MQVLDDVTGKPIQSLPIVQSEERQQVGSDAISSTS